MARKKIKYHWKKTRAGCRCMRSSEKFVKLSKCKGLRKTVCAKKRRKPTAAPIPNFPLDVPGWAPITSEAQAQALTGLGYFHPRRRRFRW